MKRGNKSIILKLSHRELTGSFTRCHSYPRAESKMLFDTIPHRLQFDLKNVIEDMGKHILLGMTQCGQFILTYTFTMDQVQPNDRVVYGSSSFKYQLHWWKFRVNAPATQVAEVQLFENQDVQDVLTIGIGQWPTVNNKIVVCGQSLLGPQSGDVSEFRKIYITVTLNPSLNNCKECSNLKNSQSMDDAADWDSDLSSRCLRHGLTIHTVMNVFPPFPNINLPIALKFENRVIVNTGSSIHVLYFNLEESNVNGDHCISKATIVNEELKHKLESSSTLQAFGYTVPIATQFTGKPSLCLKPRKKRWKKIDCEDNRSASDDVKLPWAFIKIRSPAPLSATREARLRQVANQVYDFVEPDEGCNLQFKWYRRRAIADKMYEFCSDDEDTENIHPLSRKYQSISHSADGTESDMTEDCDRLSIISYKSDHSELSDLFRTNVMSPISVSNTDSPCDLFTHERLRLYCEDQSDYSSTSVTKKATTLSPNYEGNAPNEKTRCRYLVPYNSTQYEKRYIEMDMEITSTITDIDDEDDVNYALPSSVHGSGYCQMHRIASTGLEKLRKSNCIIRQDTLDIEQFSYFIAVMICKSEGYKFIFCSDYDMEIVDVCPLNGDLLGILLLRINASTPSEVPESWSMKCNKEQNQFFETRCLFTWSIESRSCWLEGYTSLDKDSVSLSHNIDRFAKRSRFLAEAKKLRASGLGFFNMSLLHPIRCFEHLVLDNMDFGPSLEIIEDHLNSIAFLRHTDDSNLDDP